MKSMIDNGTIDRIFSAANVVDIVGDFVSLKKKGVNFQACCPFHNEKTPSFVVSPSKGLFKCFGCGKGGNAVTFVMEHEAMGYVDALKYVAKRYGIDIVERELSVEEVKKNDDRESMMIVSTYASDYFTKYLHNSDEGKNIGLSYFQERGFTPSTIEKFRLGFCPVSGNQFTNDAIGAGYKEQFLVSAGLTGKRESDGKLYDRFYGRIIFPIHSISGRVTAFGGRTLRSDKKVAKYVNSPESEIYHKSNILYGLFFAKKAIMQDNYCILVEGYTDVISMHQSGVENVVSSSGTSLTIEQVRLISRFTKNITVIYDGDAAGIKASLRGIDIILREGLNVRVVLMPEGEDPDSFAKRHTANELKDYIREVEEDFISFKTKVLLKGVGDDPIKRAELITDIVKSMAEVPDNIMRALYIKESAKILDISEQILLEEVARKRISHGSDLQTTEFIKNQRRLEQRSTPQSVAVLSTGNQQVGSSIDEIEKEIIKYLLKYGNHFFDYKEGKEIVKLNVADIIIGDIESNGIVLRSSAYRDIYKTYLELHTKKEELKSSEPIPIYNFINHHSPDACNAAVDILTSGDNYKMSNIWKRHDIVDQKEEDVLSEIVPRTIILYKSKAIEAIISDLQRKLTDPDLSDEDQADILFKITALNRERLSIANRLQRLML